MRNCFVLTLFLLNHLYAADPLAIPNNKTIQLDRIQNLEQRLSSLNQKIVTQRAELELLKKTVTGDFDTDARLIVKAITEVGNKFSFQEARYYMDDHEIAFVTKEDPLKPIIFDGFVKEGKHVIKVEKKYSQNSLIFTYLNEKKYPVMGEIDVELKPGHTTYVDVISFATNQEKKPLDLKYDTRLVPHTQNGRSVLPVSDMPHLLPGSPSTDTSLVIYAGKELDPGYQLASHELVLDGKHLKNAAVGTEGKLGLVLFEGAAAPGNHDLKATLRFEGAGRPALTAKFKTKLATQPGFKTSIVLTNNKKVQVDQEAL